MLRSYLLKWLFIGFLLSIASVLHAQETTSKPLQYHDSFHIDAGTMLFGEKPATVYNGVSGTVWHYVEPRWLPLPVIDIGWKRTYTLGRGFCWQSDLYWSSTHIVLAFAHWAFVLLPSYRFSIGYANSKDILLTLGFGTKEIANLNGSLAVDIPFSQHFLFSLEASHSFYPAIFLLEDDKTLLRITAKLSYKF